MNNGRYIRFIINFRQNEHITPIRQELNKLVTRVRSTWIFNQLS